MKMRSEVPWMAWALCLGLLSAAGCDKGGEPTEGAAAAVSGDTTKGDAARIGDAADWCEEHGLPESKCTKCNPALIPAFRVRRDWCEDHGFPKSACPTCNPMEAPSAEALAAARAAPGAAPSDWCGAHGLPESKCTTCNPELTAGFKAKGDWCEAHAFPESACPTCNPQPMPDGALAGVIPAGTTIRLADAEVVRDVGLQTVPARGGGLAASMSVVGTVDFDQDRLAEIQSPVSGIVREVLIDLGDEVKVGDPLFVLENADVGELQARLRVAASRLRVSGENLKRVEILRGEGVNAQRDLDLARLERETAAADERYLRDALRLSGGSGGESGRLVIRARMAGSVVRRPAVMGMAADGRESLATVADLSRMWVLLDIPEGEVALVKEGMTISVKADGDRYEGVIDWIAPEVDAHTRAVRVRATLPNPDRRLRANQFIEARLGLGAAAEGSVVVPSASLQRHGEAEVVFIQTGAATFEPRAVAAVRRRGDEVEVRGAVKVGDKVVTTGAWLLKTELSKEDIGAGCCEVEDGKGGR